MNTDTIIYLTILFIVAVSLVASLGLISNWILNIEAMFDNDDYIQRNLELNRVESSSVSKEEEEGRSIMDTSSSESKDDAQASSSIIQTNLMLNWVIMCESSGRHEGIWGRAGEYGILQFKENSFYWLAEKYNFTGDWKNQDDQISLFLLTSEEDKIQHWTCYRKWLNK